MSAMQVWKRPIIKEHIQASMINDIVKIARRYHSHDSLRNRILRVVQDHLKQEELYRKEHNEF